MSMRNKTSCFILRSAFRLLLILSTAGLLQCTGYSVGVAPYYYGPDDYYDGDFGDDFDDGDDFGDFDDFGDDFGGDEDGDEDEDRD